jgi:glycosyltransferase involved in cell wall biosynthesis
MRIYYINRCLTQYHTAPGLWGRKVLLGLRRAGADISSYPAICEAANAADTVSEPTEARPKGIARFRSFLMSQYSRPWVTGLLEMWMMGRGIAKSVLGLLWALWHRRNIETDIVLGRQVEYEATSQLVALVLGRPLVLEVHSIHFIERGKRASRLLRAFERWQWRQAARIWVNSDALKSIIVEHGISADTVRVISFGVDLDRFVPHRSANAEDSDEVHVVFVGSFYSWHGTEVLLRAFASAHEQVSGLRLTLVGDGADRKPSENLARELGIIDVVEFTGWVSNDRVIDYLERADIGVAPYLPIEPFYFDPAKIIEYMAAGLAVLASDQGRIPEMVENDVSGLLLPPGDETALTAALLRLAKDRPLRERFGKSSRQRAETLYDWPVISRQVLALCAEAKNGAERESRPVECSSSRRQGR